MTKLGQEIDFITDSARAQYNLPIVQANEGFLINSGRNSISFIQPDRQKVVLMWSLRQSQCFTSPVVYNAPSNTVHCVVDEKCIYSWNFDCEDLRAATTIKVPNNIFCLLTKDDKVLVVFESGDVFELSSISENRNVFRQFKNHISLDEKLVWAELTFKDVILVIQNKKNKEFKLGKISIENGETDSFDLKWKNADLKNWFLNSKDELLTLWSNGDMCSCYLDEFNMNLLMNFPKINEASSLAVDSLSNSHIAVMKSENSKGILEIWDLKYSTKKTTKALKNSVTRNTKIKAFSSCVFISNVNGVVMVPITLDSASLSSVVGKTSCDGQTEMEYSFNNDGELIIEDFQTETADSIDSNLSAKRLFEDIMPTLANDGREDFLKRLSDLKNVPEIEIVRMLQFSLKNVMNGPLSVENVPVEEQEILNAVLKIPFTDIFLLQYLGLLNFQEVMKALVYLMVLFTSQDFASNRTLIPSDKQIVIWMQLLLQSHFQEITLSTDENVSFVLKKLRQSVMDKMAVYSDVQLVDHLYMILQKKNILPERAAFSNYCIESVRL